MQMLWDRAEANGYAQHMTTDPLPNTPPHQVLLSVALGDHQVANVAAEVEARTIGAARADALRRPRALTLRDEHALRPRSDRLLPLRRLGDHDVGQRPDPPGGNPAKTVGTAVPPTANIPPRAGQDPHEFPRRTPANRAMKSAFLSVGGRVIDTCGGAPCHSVTG